MRLITRIGWPLRVKWTNDDMLQDVNCIKHTYIAFYILNLLLWKIESRKVDAKSDERKIIANIFHSSNARETVKRNLFNHMNQRLMMNLNTQSQLDLDFKSISKQILCHGFFFWRKLRNIFNFYWFYYYVVFKNRGSFPSIFCVELMKHRHLMSIITGNTQGEPRNMVISIILAVSGSIKMFVS